MKLPPMTALRAFEAAGRHSCMTKAARELNVTRPAVSKQLRELESWMGFDLVVRRPNSCALTEEGARYFEEVRRAFDRLRAASAAAKGRSGSRSLRVLAEADFANSWLAGQLWSFQTLHPDLQINLEVASVLDPAKTDHFDVAIFYGTGVWPGVDTQLLCRWVDFPLCSPAYLSQWRNGAGGFRSACLLHDRSPQAWSSWLAAARLVDDVDWRQGPVFGETRLSLEAAASGMGIAIGDSITAHRYIARGELVAAHEIGVVSHEGYHIVTQGEVSMNVRRFVDWLRTSISAAGVVADAAAPPGPIALADLRR